MRLLVNMSLGVALVGALVGCGIIPSQNSGSQSNNGSQMSDVKTKIQGLSSEDGVLRSESVTLSFDLEGADKIADKIEEKKFECKVKKDVDWKPCSAEKFTLTGLANGDTIDLSARGVLKIRDKKEPVTVSEASVQLKVQLDGAAAPNGLSPRLGYVLQIGTDYQATIPKGMHATEFSTSKTPGVLSFFRILNESDPMYLGNHTCDKSWDRIAAGKTAAGETNLYCHSTPTRAAYKDESEHRLANNHVEFATDIASADNDHYERISLSIFDDDFEMMNVRTRFWNVCQNSARRVNVVPMIPNFFRGVTPERVNFWMCDVYLPNMDGSPSEWRIGAFYDTDAVDWNCKNCKYGRAMEFTFMSRVNVQNHSDSSFARIAQDRMLDTIKKLRP